MAPQPSMAGEPVNCATLDAKIKIIVHDLRNTKGLLTVELYDDKPDDFIKKSGRLVRLRVDAEEGAKGVCMATPGPGNYAIAVYHDENANKKFDRNFIGLPKEGFGFSNNPKLDFGPPKYHEASFDLGEEALKVEIKVTYL